MSDNNCYCDSWESDNFKLRNQELKQRTDTKNDVKKIKSVKFTRSNREKSNIAIANNIFTDCTVYRYPASIVFYS